MYSLEYSSQFKKDFKKIAKLAIEDIVAVGHLIGSLQRGETLAARHVDHALVGDWLGFRDCHVKPDLVLIYRIHDEKLQLARIGTHSELFPDYHCTSASLRSLAGMGQVRAAM